MKDGFTFTHSLELLELVKWRISVNMIILNVMKRAVNECNVNTRPHDQRCALKTDLPIQTQVRAGKYFMGFYDNDCTSDYVRKKGTWERVAFVYDKAAQTQTIVVDGAVVKTCTDKRPFLGTGMVYLGKWKEGNLWNGKIKNATIFNMTLTADQIDAMQRNQ